MSANIQRQIDTLGTRTDSLENILGQFIASMNDMMIRRESDTRSLKEEMESFKVSVDRTMSRMEADTRSLKGEMESFKVSADKTMSRMEAGTEAFKVSVDKTMSRMEAGTEAFKEQSRADTEAFKTSVDKTLTRMEADTKKFKKETDKKWGELSNKMGTLVEDMVAPNIPGIAKKFFGDDDLDRFFVRMMIKNTADPSRRREFDVIAMTRTNFYVNETKSSPRSEYIGKFVEMLGEIRDYFPEIGDRRIIPIFASLQIPEDTMRYLTRSGIYAMGMGEDTMTLLNFRELSKQDEQSRM